MRRWRRSTGWGIGLGAAPEGAPRARRRRPRLRVLLIIVNLLILALPVGGIGLLRLYETLLLRQTEASLIDQGVLIGELFREGLRAERGAQAGLYGAPRVAAAAEVVTGGLHPRAAVLDRNRYEALPPAPDAVAPAEAPDAEALAVGLRLEPVLRRAQAVSLAGVRVVDFRGAVVATTRSELGLSLADREEVRRALEGEGVSLLRERANQTERPPLESISRGTLVRVFVAVPVVEGDRVWGAVILSRTPLDTLKGLYGFRAELALGAALLLWTSLLVSVLTSRAIVGPVQALMAQAQRVAQGHRGAATPLEDPGSYEVGELSEAVSKMAQALEARADYIGTFAANVSHEFKTPLTTIRGTVELLREHLEEMTPQERGRFLENLDGAAQRLELLVRRLLELARAEAQPQGGESASVARVLEAVSRRVGGRVQASLGEGVGEVAMSADRLEAVVGNLVDNALQHGGPSVWVEARRVGDQVEVEVRDDGAGISAGNLGRVFDRFFTTARGRGGSGLGLSIVKALVEGHGGEVRVRSRPGETVVRVRLPVSQGLAGAAAAGGAAGVLPGL